MLRGITNIPEFEIRNEIERSISPEKIEKERIGKYWPFDHSTRFWNKRQKEEYPRLNVILNSFRLTMHIFLAKIMASKDILIVLFILNAIFYFALFVWMFKKHCKQQFGSGLPITWKVWIAFCNNDKDIASR